MNKNLISGYKLLMYVKSNNNMIINNFLLPDDITIYFKFLTGKNVTLTCPNTTTIKEIREQLEDREGIPTWMSIFIFNGTKLEDENNLDSYQIKNNDIIHVILKMRG